MRGRGRVLVVLLVAAGCAAAFGVGSAVREHVYESSVEVELLPISPRSVYDATAAGLTGAEAMAAELDFVRGEAVQRALADELTLDHELDVEQAGPTTLRFTVRAETAELAAGYAQSAGAVYGAVREREARRDADAIVVGQQALVDRLEVEAALGDPEASAALPEAIERLTVAQEGRTVLEAGTAYVTGEAPVPGWPVRPRPLLAALVGLVVGLAAGAALVWLLERAVAAPDGRLARRGARLLGAGPRADAGAVSPLASGSLAVRVRWLVDDGRGAFVLLALLVGARFLVHALQGPNLVLDDLTLSYFAQEEPFGHVVPSGQDLSTTRPGAWLTFTLLHEVGRGHPMVLLWLITLLNLAVAWALLLVVRRFLPDRAALWVAALWVVLPTHTTLTVWAGAGQVVVGLVLLLLGALAFAHGRWLLAGLAMAASILCYELAIPAAVLVPSVLCTRLVPLRPDLVPGGRGGAGADAAPSRSSPLVPPPRLQRLGTLVPVVLASAWSLTHSIYERDLRSPDLVEVWTAHLGIGLFGSSSTPEWLIVLSAGFVAGGAATCLVAWVAGQRRRDEGPSLVLVGGLLMGVGLPVAVTLGIFPLGFGDRVHGISTIGSSLLLVGIGTWLWARSRTLARVGAALLVAACLVGQVVALRSWSQAGGDVVALLRYVGDQPAPETTHFFVRDGIQNRNGVIGASSPTGGANEAYLRQHPAADPDGAAGPEPATGSLTIAEQPGAPIPEGAVVLTWDQVLGYQPDG